MQGLCRRGVLLQRAMLCDISAKLGGLLHSTNKQAQFLNCRNYYNFSLSQRRQRCSSSLCVIPSMTLLPRFLPCRRYSVKVTEWNPDNVPNPLENETISVAKCFATRVSDPNNLLSELATQSIDKILNSCRSQVAIVVINRMDSNFLLQAGDKKNAAETFARTLHDKWGVGDLIKNDGVLFFVSIHDRVMFISTGKGIQDKINDTSIEKVISNAFPQLKKGNFDEALIGVAVDIAKIVNESSDDSVSRTESNLGGLIMLLLAIWMFYNTKWRKEKSSVAVTRIVDDELVSCSCCLEAYDDGKDGTTKANQKNRMQLNCGHSFCSSCLLDDSPDMPSSTHCPICNNLEIQEIDENIIIYRLNRFWYYYKSEFENDMFYIKFRDALLNASDKTNKEAVVADFQREIQRLHSGACNDGKENRKLDTDLSGDYSKFISYRDDSIVRRRNRDESSSWGGGKSDGGGGGTW